MPVRTAVASAAPIRVAAVDRRPRSPRLVRHGLGWAALCDQRTRRRRRQSGQRRGRSRLAAVRVRSLIRRSGGAEAVTRPTVLMSIPHGAAAGNVLRTGLVRRLLDTPEAPDV